MKLVASMLCIAVSACCAFSQPIRAMDLRLTGKTALVTGSTAGIGYGVAKVMLTEGAQVIINGRTQESVDKAAAALVAATGETPLTFAGEMSKADDIARLTKAFPDVGFP